MSKRKICYNCKHHGPTVRTRTYPIPHGHCSHPDNKGNYGWDTWRSIFSNCKNWEGK